MPTAGLASFKARAFLHDSGSGTKKNMRIAKTIGIIVMKYSIRQPNSGIIQPDRPVMVKEPRV
ncbi:hypothetical protein D3C79_1122000 [compost metagenome]